MAQTEETIEYTPEELAEIDRIISVVTEEEPPSAQEILEPLQERPASSETVAGVEDFFPGEPDDLDLPSDALEGIEEDMISSIEMPEDIGISEEIEIQAEDLTDDFDEFPEELSFTEDIKEEGPEEFLDGEIEDITNLIHEVSDETAPENIIPETEELPDIISIEEAGEPQAAKREGSPLEQLDELTRGEPESLDSTDFAEDEFIGMDEPEAEVSLPEEEISEASDFSEEVTDEKSGITFEEDEEIPDLSDISLTDAEDMADADTSDIPDIDLDSIGAPETGGISEDIETEAVSFEEPADTGLDIGEDDLGIFEEDVAGDEELPDIDLSPVEESSEDLVIEPLDEEGPEHETPEMIKPTASEEPSADLSEKELKKLKKAIQLFNPGMIRAIKDTIINDRIPAGQIHELVNMIISGRPESSVKDYLEEALSEEIEFTEEIGTTGRRVITSRPEYTREGRERQKRLLWLTKIFSAAALLAFVLTVLGYQYIYKPMMAKKKISEGVALIMKPGDYARRTSNFSEAENIFRYVDENYKKNYIDGYNRYGRAYFDRRKPAEYIRSLNKLDKAYELDKRNVDTLNNLGYYYSRVPAGDYKRVEGQVAAKYYSAAKDSRIKKTQLDVAIDFYKRALVLDKENISSMVGIGNAYFYQGEYLKARNYYEDILKLDRDSVVGFAGLLNLYIERDSFPKVSETHVELKSRDMLEEMPSALLAKLADFYLSKRKTDDMNVRVDYGLQSPRLKDIDDNTFPAVLSVLRALNARDPDYPPLQIHYARMNRMKNNYPVMERYLKKALSLSPDYFAALHLLGEYYYDIKQPVESYSYLKKAIEVYGRQPDFTRDDFYKETEKIGKTYAVMGNIFYYFFDKVKYRFGDLDDELLDDEIEKMANYNVAREKYEMAIKSGFESSEVHYNLGRVYYLNRLYSDALDQWLNLYEDFVNRPELMYALGNAYYHKGNHEAARGEYLKLVSYLEFQTEKIKKPDPERTEHVKLFQTLASVYNNLGAVYQIHGDDSKSSVSYWKAIDYAKRLDRENEFARVNMARSYKPGRKIDPIIDENIPYSIDIYRHEMRNR